MPEQYDVVIVGAGMAGGILAARIAERGVNPRTGEKLRVALMDMGPYFKGDPRPGYGIPVRRQAWSNMPGDDLEPYRRVYSTPWGTAIGVGGQSNHWHCQSRLPLYEDHEGWMKETGVDWSYDKMTAARTELTEMFHIRPEPEEVLGPGSFLFRDAARAMGYEVLRFTSSRLNCIWCGQCMEHGCKYDAKSGSLTRYIPIAERNGVEIMPFTTVEKVILEKRGAAAVATGVVFTQAGKTQEARAGKVIVSCNISGTPVLLLRSGYGPRELVKGELIVENPNICRNLNGYYDVPVFGVFDVPVRRSDLGWYNGFYFIDKNPQGHLRFEAFDIFGRHEMYPSEWSVDEFAPDFGREHKEFMRKWLNWGCVFGKVTRTQDLWKGQMDASGRGIRQPLPPEILKRAQEVREIMRDILLKMGAKRVSDISKPLEATFAGGSVGSCRGGADRTNSVVNSDFECHDVENLFLCDASVVPSIPSAHNGGTGTAFMACHAWRRIVAKHFSR